MTTAMTTALEHIRAAAVMCAGVDPDAVTPDATLDTLAIDSLTLAECLFYLEDSGIKVREPTVRPQTVADLVALIEPAP